MSSKTKPVSFRFPVALWEDFTTRCQLNSVTATSTLIQLMENWLDPELKLPPDSSSSMPIGKTILSKLIEDQIRDKPTNYTSLFLGHAVARYLDEQLEKDLVEDEKLLGLFNMESTIDELERRLDESQIYFTKIIAQMQGEMVKLQNKVELALNEVSESHIDQVIFTPPGQGARNVVSTNYAQASVRTPIVPHPLNQEESYPYQFPSPDYWKMMVKEHGITRIFELFTIECHPDDWNSLSFDEKDEVYGKFLLATALDLEVTLRPPCISEIAPFPNLWARCKSISIECLSQSRELDSTENPTGFYEEDLNNFLYKNFVLNPATGRHLLLESYSSNGNNACIDTPSEGSTDVCTDNYIDTCIDTLSEGSTDVCIDDCTDTCIDTLSEGNFYNESESSDVIQSFKELMASFPVVQDNESIYSEEELRGLGGEESKGDRPDAGAATLANNNEQRFNSENAANCQNDDPDEELFKSLNWTRGIVLVDEDENICQFWNGQKFVLKPHGMKIYKAPLRQKTLEKVKSQAEVLGGTAREYSPGILIKRMGYPAHFKLYNTKRVAEKWSQACLST